MWEVIPRELKKMNIPRPGSFDKNNCHAGKMWGWPSECNMTDKKALKIMFLLYESKKVTVGHSSEVKIHDFADFESLCRDLRKILVFLQY